MYVCILLASIFLSIFESVFIRDIVLYFYFCCRFGYQNSTGFKEVVLELSFSFYFLPLFDKDQLQIFLKCLVEYCYQYICFWTLFIILEAFHYYFKFLTCYGSGQVVDYLVNLDCLAESRNACFSPMFFNLMVDKVSKYSLIIFCISWCLL